MTTVNLMTKWEYWDDDGDLIYFFSISLSFLGQSVIVCLQPVICCGLVLSLSLSLQFLTGISHLSFIGKLNHFFFVTRVTKRTTTRITNRKLGVVVQKLYDGARLFEREGYPDSRDWWVGFSSWFELSNLTPFSYRVGEVDADDEGIDAGRVEDYGTQEWVEMGWNLILI